MPLKDRERPNVSLRGLSRRATSRMQRVPSVKKEKTVSDGKEMKKQHSMKRTSSLSKKMTRNKSLPQYGSRAKTGPISLRAKEAVLKKFPQLEIKNPVDKAEQIVLQGINSFKAELVDMNSMCVVMEENKNMLTFKAVEKFFEWVPLFDLFLERYMLVEEDFVVKWVEGEDMLKGDLRPGNRMLYRGSIQKCVRDIQDLQDDFVPHLPPGQTLPKLIDACDDFTTEMLLFFSRLESQLPPLLKKRFTNHQIEKQIHKIVKHVVSHIGYQDFLAIYTRWMPPAGLLTWKTKVLLPCDFKFFSYRSWESDMDNAHYNIAASFGEKLEEENRQDHAENAERQQDFERAKMQRREMEMGALEVELEDEEESEG